MRILSAVTVSGLSCLVAWAGTKALIPVLRRTGALDVPNARSSHSIPTPRGGGLGILTGVAAGVVSAVLMGMQLPTFELLLGASLIALVGFLDDRPGGLSASLRLVLHLVSSGLVVHAAGGLVWFPLPAPFDVPLGVLGIPLALIWIVGVTNVYNFLDGIDGFAALQGVVVGLGLAFLDSGGSFMPVGLAVSGACAGFLFHNWHPAKVFMGDVGSGTLGFLLAASPFQLDTTRRGEAIFVVAMCLWFFLSDGAFTIFRRFLRGEKVWEAHHSHLYQRLVTTGLRHDEVVLVVGGAACLLAGMAVASARVPDQRTQWAVFVSAVAGFLVYYQWTRQRERGPKEEFKESL